MDLRYREVNLWHREVRFVKQSSVPSLTHVMAGYQRVSTGIMASSGPQRSSAQSRGAKDNTDRPTSASTKRGQYAAVPKTTKTTKPKRRVGNKADQPQQIIFESVPSKADDLIDARASLSSWEEQYPAWYGVLECLIRTEHVEEWKLPLGVVTPNRADESLVEARIWYGERNPLPLASGARIQCLAIFSTHIFVSRSNS